MEDLELLANRGESFQETRDGYPITSSQTPGLEPGIHDKRGNPPEGGDATEYYLVNDISYRRYVSVDPDTGEKIYDETHFTLLPQRLWRDL